MPNMKYVGILEQANDGTWSGHIPDVPEVHATGDTLEIAKNKMREALDRWTDDMKRNGKPIPSPSVQAVVIEVPD